MSERPRQASRRVSFSEDAGDDKVVVRRESVVREAEWLKDPASEILEPHRLLVCSTLGASEAIVSFGITYIVNLAADDNGIFEDPEGRSLLHVATGDSDSTFNDDIFSQITQFIHHALMQENSRVLVHCLDGMSRSPSVVVAYLMYAYANSYPLTDAMDAVKTRRAIADFSAHHEALVHWENLLKEQGFYS